MDFTPLNCGGYYKTLQSYHIIDHGVDFIPAFWLHGLINLHINLSSNSSHKSIFLDNLNEKVIILSFLAYIFIKRTFLQKKREGKKVKEPWLYSTYLEILKILACSGARTHSGVEYLVGNSIKSTTLSLITLHKLLAKQEFQ